MPAVELVCPPPNTICSMCGVLEEAELWRCGDCGSDKYFCATCAVRKHSTPNIVHQLELWKSGQFIPCVPVGLRWEWRRQDGHDCHSQYNRLLNVVDIRVESFSKKGKYLKRIRFHGRGMFAIMDKVHCHYFVKLVEGLPSKVEQKTGFDHAKEYVEQVKSRTIIHAL